MFKPVRENMHEKPFKSNSWSYSKPLDEKELKLKPPWFLK